ncbi:hypothetical protein [Clostridium grantii]|uniref:Uncharacterized protein n=1 Tax=Clostridium grantii DSM 8605 TaxID=1121316 RepID=A0A1M5U7X6_9CLOT|nr:hypothetical protein [Clostridium grantii]SHH59011.1 hypothetical protein SAMN02745207_01626 [Clostridium grantii DSM 8605]
MCFVYSREICKRAIAEKTAVAFSMIKIIHIHFRLSGKIKDGESSANETA